MFLIFFNLNSCKFVFKQPHVATIIIFNLAYEDEKRTEEVKNVFLSTSSSGLRPRDVEEPAKETAKSDRNEEQGLRECGSVG